MSSRNPGTAAEAAGPRIKLEDGKQAWGSPSDLPAGAKDALKLVLGTIKAQATDKGVTQDELDYFVRLIFASGWKTGSFIRPPVATTTPKLDHIGIPFGRLAKHAPASARESKQRPPRSRVAKSAYEAPPTEKEHRREGQPVYLMVESRQSGFLFTYRDKRGGLFGNINFDLNRSEFGTMDEVYLEVMRSHDQFFQNVIMPYNISMGVYIARNRLTHWANGHSIWTMPRGEHFDLALADFLPIRRANDIYHKAQSAFELLQQDDEPVLWPALARDSPEGVADAPIRVLQ